MQSFFALNKIDETEQARDFSKTFNVLIEKMPDIPGNSGDYIIVQTRNKDYPLNTVIEFKNDKASKRTGNMYVEFEQTCDNWFTSKTSGIKLAIKNGQIVVIKSATENFIIRNHTEYTELTWGKHDTLTTRSGSNGNSNGCYTRGHLVSLVHARTILDSF